MLHMSGNNLHGERENRLLRGGFGHLITSSNVINGALLKTLLRK
jgi:hypothetical protein